MYETGYYSTGYYATGYYSRRAQEGLPTLRFTWEGIIAEARYILQDLGLTGLTEQILVEEGAAPAPGTIGTLYAVGIDSANPGDPVLLRSTDGGIDSWELVNTGVQSGLFQFVLYDICYAPNIGDNGRILCVGQFNRGIYSDDLGVTWTYITFPSGGGNWFAVAHNGVVFVSGTAAGKLYSSDDGITWTERFDEVASYNDVVWDPVSELFIAVASDSNVGIINTSPDGITWTRNTDPDLSGLFIPDDSNCVGLGNGTYCVPSGNPSIQPRHVYSSDPDGAWTGLPVNPHPMYKVAYSPNLDLWMGTQISDNANFSKSSDLTQSFTEIANNNANGGDWRTCCWSEQNSAFVFLGSGTSGGNIMTTDDGTNFTTQAQPSMVPHLWVQMRELQLPNQTPAEPIFTKSAVLSPERYRWTDDVLLDSLNRGIEELKRVRPDAYYTLFGIYDGYTPEVVQTGADAGQVNWNADFLLEKHFYTALVHYVVSQAFMEEDSNLQQANEHLQLFRKFALAI